LTAGRFVQDASMLGFDFEWLLDPTYQHWLLIGIANTIKLALVSSLFAIVLGLAGSYALLLRFTPLTVLIEAGVEIFRNTPPLLQMLFFYFTLTELGLTVTDSETGVKVPLLGAFSCAAISLSLFGAALTIEAFRAGFEAIPKSTVEAARSLGYTRFSLFSTIQLPIAMRIALPSLTNIVTNLFKTTSQASIITVPDLMYYAGQIYNDTFRTSETMLLVLLVYVVLVTIVAGLMGLAERAFAYPGYGR
jgi:polar amino acid transport system permease protein